MRRLLATQFNYCWNMHNGKLTYFSHNHHSPTFTYHVINDALYLDSTRGFLLLSCMLFLFSLQLKQVKPKALCILRFADVICGLKIFVRVTNLQAGQAEKSISLFKFLHSISTKLEKPFLLTNTNFKLHNNKQLTSVSLYVL